MGWPKVLFYFNITSYGKKKGTNPIIRIPPLAAVTGILRQKEGMAEMRWLAGLGKAM